MAKPGSVFLQELSERLIRWRLVFILLVVAVAGFCAYFYNKVPRDPSVEAMVLEDDPDLLAYNRFKKIFGNDEFLLLAAEAPDIFDPQLMKDTSLLCDKIEELPFIKEATSFVNTRSIHGSDDTLVVEELVPEIPETKEGLAALKKRAMSETDFIGNYYNEKATTFTIIGKLETLSKKDDSTDTRIMITRKARELIKQKPFAKYNWKLAGVPVLKADLVTTQKSESLKFQLYIFGLLTFVLYIIFRTISGTLITLIAVQAVIFMLMAAHYFSGIALTMVSTILTPLMLIYGVSSSVHIQTHYALNIGSGKLKRQALIAAVAATLIPCTFNSVTTAVGLGSNVISSIKPIREFAMFSSSGVIMSLVVTFLIIPAALSFFPKPGKQTQKANEKGLRVFVLEGIVKLVSDHTKAVIVVTLILFGISAYGMSLINVETDLLSHFKEDSDIRQSYKFIDENISGISSMEIMIDTKEKGGMKDPEVIAAISRLADYIRKQEPKVTSTISIENMYKRINMALHGDDPKWRKIPETRQEAAQFLLLYSMSGPESDLYNFVSSDYRYGRISSRLHTMSSGKLEAVVHRIKEKTEEAFATLEERGIEVHVTGSAVLYANMNATLIMGQIKSFSLSLLLISIMMILVAGELGLGLVSLLPNLMPIAVTMGIMGYAGILLDSTTAMVAPIALGMAVDSTIHFMVRFRREYLARGSYDAAAASTIRIIGRAMIGTSVPLAAGFLILTTSVFYPVLAFGLLSGIVVLLAMVFDLVLTPICMVLYKPTYKNKGLVDFFE